jgi:uncharacterized repeat protein (TIGR04138 family)
MQKTLNVDEVLEKILAKDPRYPREAYHFVREALDHTQKIAGKAAKGQLHHVTGQELLEGIRQCGLQQFGPMALTVFHEWGVRRGEDFGEIVFNMVEHSLLGKTDQDSRDDFKGGYQFDEAFRKPFVPANRAAAPESKPTGA